MGSRGPESSEGGGLCGSTISSLMSTLVTTGGGVVGGLLGSTLMSTLVTEGDSVLGGLLGIVISTLLSALATAVSTLPCIRRMCDLRLFFKAKRFWHTGQVCGFSPVCTIACLVKALLSMKAAGHRWHAYGFVLLCHLRCHCSVFICLKDLPHSGQWHKSTPFTCNRMCVSSDLFLPNFDGQRGHACRISLV